MNTKWLLAGMIGLLAVASCRPDDQRTDTLDPSSAMQRREDMPAEVLAQLDSGSAAFRAHDFQAALAYYTRVTEMAPNAGAGWFGVYMAEDALGNADEAERALERVKELVPGASLVHENGSNEGG